MSNIETLPSPVAALLLTNDPPNNLQSDAIRDTLAYIRTDLKILDSEIEDMQRHERAVPSHAADLARRITDLRKKQESVQEFADKHTIPIRGLPIELLERIFMLSLPQYPDLMKIKEGPMLLGQVCGFWRAVSRGTPTLWSTIKVKDIGSNKKLIAALREWLQRTGDCPLTLQYDTSHLVPQNALEWDVIVGHWSQIEHLDLHVPDAALACWFPENGRNFVGLKSLQISRYWDTKYHLVVISPQMFKIAANAPQLSAVRLDIDIGYCSLPFAQITTCDVEITNLSNCVELLRVAVNLVDCTIRWVEYLTTPDAARTVIRHPKLEKLAIRIGGRGRNDALDYFLSHLELPSLREFEWRPTRTRAVHDGAGTWPGDTFSSFLVRSQCTLSRLWITSGPSEKDISRYLLEVPTLVDLSFGTPQGGSIDELLRELQLGGHGLDEPVKADLVPNLEHLTIIASWGDFEEITKLVKSRCDGGGNSAGAKRLKSASLALGVGGLSNVSEAARGRLEECVQAGLIQRYVPEHELYSSW